MNIRAGGLAAALAIGPSAWGAPTVATLDVPGPPAFVAAARDVSAAAFAVDPSLAANAGLFDDAMAVPHYDRRSVRALVKRLDRDLKQLERLDWDALDPHTQVDVRWVYAVAETTRRALVEERLYVHRPAQWLEPVANTLIALGSYAPGRPELQDRVLVQVPAMLDDARAQCTEPTRRDVQTAVELTQALAAIARTRDLPDVAEALLAYEQELQQLTPAEEYRVIGAENYAWRLEHTMLLPWTPAELDQRARQALAEVDARLAELPALEPVTPTPEQTARGEALDRDGLLALYDAIEEAHRAATIAGGWVTVPEEVGPVRARETPDAMAPLTGDGGSMNPPPTFGDSTVGYWNVEKFRSEWTVEERAVKVATAQGFLENRMGPYSAHEGFPGHHLQLAIARLNPDPLRSILPDPLQNEGWGLYAEEAFLAHGGLGDSALAQANVLRSYRFRILRVPVDVAVETGQWTLEQAAEFKYGPGGEVDADVLRAIHWPTQLVCYFAGKAQIVALRDEWKARNPTGTEREFHDAFLQAGSIPISLIRAELLGEPVPPLR